MRTAVLYIGTACHLCDFAKNILEPIFESKEWDLKKVNINTSDTLREKYGNSIPVVSFPSGKEKGWPFTESQIRDLIKSEDEAIYS
tara:strand:- start:254 stop:511 length:258 start_codon:yes stop_codon:yes gene_type:complete